jgi:hypothetical protein
MSVNRKALARDHVERVALTVSGPPEFKARAIDLCRSSEGLTIADVARELGIGTKTSRKGVHIRLMPDEAPDPAIRDPQGLGS